MKTLFRESLKCVHIRIKVATAFATIVFAANQDCSWRQRDNTPDIYFINMDKSVDRKINMQRHLSDVGFSHHRVRGITPQEIYIPEDIEETWRTAWCKLKTSWNPPSRKHVDSYSAYYPYTAFMTAMCGRGKKKNNPKELGCTTSHLMAMRDAVYSNSKSRYALIVEDDVQFPFDVDWQALAESAPPGFGILQLFNSNENTMSDLWRMYVRDKTKLWVDRDKKKDFSFWSTCAYMIDRVAMKPVVDAVIFEVNGWTSFNVIAGITTPCVPQQCCNSTDNFVRKPPCVYAPRGYQADSFLYAMTKTLMLTVPLISNGLGGNQSTFHQDHVESIHRGAFRKQREYINQMLTGKVAPPSFAKAACKPLDIAQL